MLPPAKRLADQILSERGTGQAIDYIDSHIDELRTCGDVESFAISEEKRFDGLKHHFVRVRAGLIRQLWSRELFVGVSVVDQLLFGALTRNTARNAVLDVLTFIRDRGIHKPGLLLVPVHSFGVLGFGFIRFFEKTELHFMLKEYGLALTAQTNSMSETFRFLEDVRRAFGVAQEIPRDLMQHWVRSRRLEWLSSNPLLLLKTSSFPGSYYENQSLLLERLQFSTSLVFLLAALEPNATEGNVGSLSSTRMQNNWQTLDLTHYIVLYRSPRGRELSGDCVPMMSAPPDLVAVTDLGVNLDPKRWRRRTALMSRVVAAVTRVQQAYFSHKFHGDNSTRAKVHRKLFRALRFFRRSFRSYGARDEALVNLGAAFEVLLPIPRMIRCARFSSSCCARESAFGA